MGAPINGNEGSATFGATAIDDLTTWSVSFASDNQPYVSSDTAGQTKRIEGNKDWTGSITNLPDNGEELALKEGDKGTIELLTSSNSGEGGKWSGASIVDNVDYDVDVNGGTIQNATIAVAADGALTFTANP